MWEAIGQFGSIDGYQGAYASMASGWSSGGAPLLTRYVLGVRPTKPGYASFAVDPHLGDTAWARGGVPTPGGVISVDVRRSGKRLRVLARFPAGLNGVLVRPGAAAVPLRSGVATTR